MKRIIALLLAAVLMMGLVACSGEKKEPEFEDEIEIEEDVDVKEDEDTAEESETVEVATEPPAPAKTMETDVVKVDGFYVDNSHQESDGSPLKMVYVFLTFKPSQSNFKVDSKYTDLVIGENTYSSDFYKNACKFTPSYYYSSFIEDIYVGTECKLALTFKVPEGDLQPGKDVTMSDSSFSLDGLLFSTDDLVVCESAEEIGSLADPEAYAEIAYMRELADEETTKKVQKLINGYYWQFYVTLGTSLTKYELEFYSPNEFEVRTPYLSNNGTYEVHNGYIFLYYYTSDTPVEIKYEFQDGDVALYCADAFSIYE